MRMLWNLLEGEACTDFQFREKSTMCIWTLALCTALFDAYFWGHHNKGRLVRSRLWQCEQNSDLVNYFWQLIYLLPRSLPFSKRRLWKLESRSEIWSFNVEYSIPINKVSISDVTLLKEIFLWNNPKSCVLLTCQLELRKLFVKVKIILITYFEYFYFFFSRKRRGAINAKQLMYLEQYKPSKLLREKGGANCCIQ